MKYAPFVLGVKVGGARGPGALVNLVRLFGVRDGHVALPHLGPAARFGRLVHVQGGRHGNGQQAQGHGKVKGNHGASVFEEGQGTLVVLSRWSCFYMLRSGLLSYAASSAKHGWVRS